MILRQHTMQQQGQLLKQSHVVTALPYILNESKSLTYCVLVWFKQRGNRNNCFHYVLFVKSPVRVPVPACVAGLIFRGFFQDLPNNMIHQVPIKSLPQEWLWCETWCDDSSKKSAKTIDLVTTVCLCVDGRDRIRTKRSKNNRIHSGRRPAAACTVQRCCKEEWWGFLKIAMPPNSH